MAFVTADQKATWVVLRSYGVDSIFIAMLKDIDETAGAAVRVCKKVG